MTNLYAFQGQESDDEIKGDGNSVNYKYRMHDPRLGRFFAIDPLASKYPHNSTYAFSENRVMDGVELEGLEFSAMGSFFENLPAFIASTESFLKKEDSGTLSSLLWGLKFMDGVHSTATIDGMANEVIVLFNEEVNDLKALNNGEMDPNHFIEKYQLLMSSDEKMMNGFVNLAKAAGEGDPKTLGQILGMVISAKTLKLPEINVKPNYTGKIISSGKIHGTNTHFETMNRFAKSYSSQNETVYLNKSINTALGKKIKGVGGKRPDLISIAENGEVTLVEVISPSQTPQQMIKKVNKMADALRKENITVKTRVVTESGGPIDGY
jgi:RHS repeat-associated protein